MSFSQKDSQEIRCVVTMFMCRVKLHGGTYTTSPTMHLWKCPSLVNFTHSTTQSEIAAFGICPSLVRFTHNKAQGESYHEPKHM